MKYIYLLATMFALTFLASCSEDDIESGVRYRLDDVYIETDSIVVPFYLVTESSDQVTVFRDSINSPVYYTVDKEDVNILQEEIRFAKKDVNFYQTDKYLYVYTKKNYAGLYIIAFFGFVFWATLIYLIFFYIPFGLWYQAFISGVRLSPFRMILTKMRNVPIKTVLNIMILAHKSNLKLQLEHLENLHLAKVNIEEVVNVLIVAQNSGLTLPFNDLLRYYLAKVDVKMLVLQMVEAKNAGITLVLAELAEHYLAKVNIPSLVKCLIMAQEGGVQVSKAELVRHQLAGGNIDRVISAVVAARNADSKLVDADKLNLDFNTARNIDLAGINIQLAVKDAIDFRVITVENITAVAIDGVQLTMRAEVTIRPKISMIIESAGEKTVIAQVIEAISTEIGSTDSHFRILENPYIIADNVIRKQSVGLGTAYKIISIDISRIDVGKDIHSELQIERAKAEAEKAKAEVIKADEKVKKAMAAAFLDGKLTVQQYYNLENQEADTQMRKSFSKPPVTDSKDHNGNHQTPPPPNKH